METTHFNENVTNLISNRFAILRPNLKKVSNKMLQAIKKFKFFFGFTSFMFL